VVWLTVGLVVGAACAIGFGSFLLCKMGESV
jgi:hypothetical protein